MTEEEIAQLQQDLEEARKALKAVNGESAERRIKLDEMSSNLGTVTQERDKALQQTALLQAQLDRERLQSAVLLEAHKIGFMNPQDAAKLTDISGLTLTENGTVAGLTERLEALKGRLPMKLAAGTPKRPKAGAAQGSNETFNLRL